MKRQIMMALLFGMLVSGWMVVGAAEYFVSPSGDDKQDGKTWVQSLCTISNGIQRLKPGDILTIGPGIYHESIRCVLAGASNAPITIRAARPRSVCLDGFVSVPRFTRVAGMNYTYSAPAKVPDEESIVIERKTGRRLRHCPNPTAVEQVLGSYCQGEGGMLYVHATDSSDPNNMDICLSVLADGMYFEARGSGTNMVGARNLIIDGLEIRGYSGVNRGFGGHGLGFEDAEDVVVRNCEIHDCGYGIWFRHKSYRLKLLNNSVYRCWCSYLESGNIKLNGDTYNSVAAGNRVFDTETHGLRQYSGTNQGESGTFFESNLVWNCQNSTIQFKGGVVGQARYNVCSGYSSCLNKEYNNTVCGEALDEKGTMYDPSDLFYGEFKCARCIPDPKFVDPMNWDFRLQSDSPARGKGPKGTDLGAFPYKGDVFFVSPQGNDQAEGTSLATAWKTLARACAAAKPGQTILLCAGTYQDSLVPAVSGTREHPIVYRRRGEDNVCLKGNKQAVGVDLRERSYIRIEGLDISGFTEAGIITGGKQSEGIELVRCLTHDNAADGIMLSSVAARVERCTSVGNGRYGIQVSGTGDVFISSSIIAMNQAGQIAADGSTLYSDFNNLWPGNPNVVAGVADPGDPEKTRLRSESFGGQAGLTEAGYRKLAIVTTPSSSNVLCAEAPVGVWRGQAVSSLENWQKESGQDLHSLSRDPFFTDPKNGDFRLSAKSPSLSVGWAWCDQGGAGKVAPKAGFEIARLTVSGITPTTATVSWWTETVEGNTRLEWGLTRELGQTVFRRFEHGSFHHVTLTGLTPRTTYYFRASSQSPGWLMHGNPVLWAQEEELKRKETQSSLAEFRTMADELPAKILYVTHQGQDENDGLSPAKAFRHINRAAELALPGDTVLIEPGNYEEMVMPLHSGVTNRPITFKSADWRPVVIDGHFLQPMLVSLLGKDCIILEGFHFKGHQYHQYRGYCDGGDWSAQVWLDHANHIIVRRCFFDGRGNYYQLGIGSAKNGNSSILVEDCAFLGLSKAGYVWDTRCEFNHCVFGICFFGQVLGDSASFIYHNSVITSAVENKQYAFGYMVWAMGGGDAKAVQSDYNAFWYQPYDDKHWVAVLNGSDTGVPEKDADCYFGDEGLKRWRANTGNDEHSLITKNPGFQTYQGAIGWTNGMFGDCENSQAPKKVEWLDDFRPSKNSPLRGKGENGADIGIRFPVPGK